MENTGSLTWFLARACSEDRQLTIPDGGKFLTFTEVIQRHILSIWKVGRGKFYFYNESVRVKHVDGFG